MRKRHLVEDDRQSDDNDGDLRQELLDCLKQIVEELNPMEFTKEEIYNSIGAADDTAFWKRNIQKLLREGYIERVGKERFTVTPLGIANYEAL